MLRTPAAMGLGLIGLAFTTIAPASAVTGGNRTPLDNTGTQTVFDLCPFPVDVTAHTVGTVHVQTIGSGGSILRAHLNEVDTFEANGNTITGGPYTWELQVTFDA